MSQYVLSADGLKATAAGAARCRAIAACEPDPDIRNPDYLAKEFLDPGLEPQVESPQQVAHLVGALEQDLPGAYHFRNARTIHIDGILRRELDGGARQVVILGAGYDTRAYRFGSSAPEARFFEVDLPDLQQDKMAKVAALLGTLPDNVTYVPVDFSRQRLDEALPASGYDAALRSFFDWEEGCYYLTPEGVDATLAFVAGGSPRGSTLVFDYVPRSMVRGTREYYGGRECRDYLEELGAAYAFGIEDGSTARFLAPRGFSVLSDMGPRELQRRYLVRSDGKLHGRLPGFVRVVHAQVERRANWVSDLPVRKFEALTFPDA